MKIDYARARWICRYFGHWWKYHASMIGVMPFYKQCRWCHAVSDYREMRLLMPGTLS